MLRIVLSLTVQKSIRELWQTWVATSRWVFVSSSTPTAMIRLCPNYFSDAHFDFKRKGLTRLSSPGISEWYKREQYCFLLNSLMRNEPHFPFFSVNQNLSCDFKQEKLKLLILFLVLLDFFLSSLLFLSLLEEESSWRGQRHTLRRSSGVMICQRSKSRELCSTLKQSWLQPFLYFLMKQLRNFNQVIKFGIKYVKPYKRSGFCLATTYEITCKSPLKVDLQNFRCERNIGNHLVKCLSRGEY